MTSVRSRPRGAQARGDLAAIVLEPVVERLPSARMARRGAHACAMRAARCSCSMR
jgi:hypothetical protein